MKTIFTLVATLLISTLALSQTLEITSPALTPPYEVAPGTEVTFEWEHFGSPPTAYFTHDEEPEFPSFGTDPEWQQYTEFIDNGDGTFGFTHTIDEEIWILGGFYQSFLGSWVFSNVIHISIASGVEITYEDGLVCPDGSGSEILSVTESYETYQWYLDNTPIEGATEQTYAATLPGAYKVEVPLDGSPTFSNTLTLDLIAVEISGSHIPGATTVEVSATPGFDAYQWLLGPETSPEPIPGAVSSDYTANLTPTPEWISVEATLDGCTVQSESKMLLDQHFEIPQIVVSADTNSFGNVCEGTDVELAVADHYGAYNWTRDGMEVWAPSNTLNVSQSYQAGDYQVTVSPPGWPEIEVTSNTVSVGFFSVIQPQLFTDVSGPYCPGDEINITLADEGYDYTWYLHTDFNYTESDEIEVEGSSYTLDFEESVRITVVADYEGCTNSRTLNLNSVANSTPYISLSNWDQQYLCTDSVAHIGVSEWSQADFTNYQWYRQVDEEWEVIEGETAPTIGAVETGVYSVRAQPVGCTVLELSSNEVEIFDFSERTLNIYLDNPQICDGDVAVLNVPGGESVWQNIQWFEGNIQMGSQGYEEVFNPIPGSGSAPEQEVSEFNGYLAKARHHSCPTGVKITSNIVRLKPLLNPTVTVDPDYGINNWHLGAYDSIPSYLYCPDQLVQLSTADEYADYEWYTALYTGTGNYQLGSIIPGSEGPTTDFVTQAADWVTLKVTDDEGCVGYSTPILIDTYVFAPVTITSYSNAELCGPGDSTLLHVSFPGNYALVEWYRDGVLIEGANNDSIWADTPGEYTVTVYREECPNVSISSGVGPYVSFLDAWIVEQAELIYAMPQFGFYEYQWYLDGEPYENNTSTPWILYKDDMPEGIYTVEVSNPDTCTVLSDPFLWDPTSTADRDIENLIFFPNPTTGKVHLRGHEAFNRLETVVRDLTGREILRNDRMEEPIDLSKFADGTYIIEIYSDAELILTEKVMKH